MEIQDPERKWMPDRVESIAAVKERILDIQLIATLAMWLPLTLIVLLRSFQVGFRPIIYAMAISFPFILFLYLARRRLRFRLRGSLFLGWGFGTGCFALASYGLVGLGPSVMLAGTIITALIFGPRSGIVMGALSLVAMFLIGLAVNRGWLVHDFDVRLFMTDPSSWLTMMAGYAAFSAAIMLGFWWINRAFVEAIDKLGHRSDELEQTNRRLEEEGRERREMEERLRLTQFSVDNAAVPAFWIDQTGTILYCNQAASRLSGFSLDELVGLPFFKVAPEVNDEVFRALWDLISREGEYHGRHTLRDRSGRDFPAEITAKYLEFMGRKYVFGYAQDISQSQLLEEQFLQAQKMEAVGRLAGGVAHDFNNQLTVIFSVCDLLLHDMPAADSRRRMIEMIKDSAEKSAGLTHQLLAFSRKQIVSPKLVNLNTAISDLQKMLGRLIGENIKMTLKLDPRLGLVRVDPVQIEQVIVNLAVNARDAMPNGGRLSIETVNLAVDEEYARPRLDLPAGNYVVMAISDTGIGMDKEVLDHIFEPFFTTKSRDKGTGLGLATVYGIIKQAGGGIRVYSEPGFGSTFRVYLGRADQAEETGAASDRLEPAPRGDETVLLAEDDHTVRDAASEILSSHGYRVLAAASGEEALEVFSRRADEIALLITDVIMTGINGRELANRVHQIRPDLPCLYISGYTDDIIAHHGVLDPEIDYLAKPFPAIELLKKVREIIDRGPGTVS